MPLLSILPQVALQSAPVGLAVWFAAVVELESGWVSSHCRFVGGAFSKLTVNSAVCGGVIPTGTVAAGGVTDTRMPVSRPMVAVPVALDSASAVAVNVSTGMGLGKPVSDGAVKTKTLGEAVSVVVQVPTVPPFNDIPLVQAAAVVGVGLGCAAV